MVSMAASDSKSMVTSRPLSGIIGAETPPGMTALILRPGLAPPPWSSTSSLSEMPMGSSYTPGFWTWPLRQ